MTLLPTSLLLTLFLKSLLVFAAAGTLLFALRRSSAAARHLVCLLTLGAILALPLFSLALPGWHLPVLGAQEPTPVRLSPALPVREGKEFSPAISQASHPVPVAASYPASAASSSSSLTGRTPAKQGGGFLLLYALGLLLASLRPLLGLWGIRRLSRCCIQADDEPTLITAAACASLLGLQMPRLCRADVPVPMTWGWHCPVIVLPPTSAGWPETRLRSVLLHEMAHVRRRDWPGYRLADLACALLWFHPLVWLTARRLWAESEVACDDLVLASGVPAPDYARHLLEIASALPRASRPSSAAIAMAQTSQIESRLPMILDKTRTRRTVARRVLLAALIPGTAALVTLAILRPDAKVQTAPTRFTASTAAKPSNQFMQWTSGRIAMSKNTQGEMNFVTSPDFKINGTTLFAGVTDANKPGSQWWSASGAVLPAPVYDANAHHAENHASPDKHTVSFAFRLPADAVGTTVRYELPQCTQSSSEGSWPGKMRDDAGLTEAQQFTQTGGVRVVTAAYPASVSKVSIRVGIASGPWKLLTKIVPGQADMSALTTADGSFIVGPLESATTGNILSVSASQLTQDIRIVGVDMVGRDEFPATLGDQSIGTLDQISAHFNFPLVPLKAVRIETRPFQWIEYKDVALKPVK